MSQEPLNRFPLLVGHELIRIFFQVVQPHFPVLSRHQGSGIFGFDGTPKPENLPIPVLAAVYALALPFATPEIQTDSARFPSSSVEGLWRTAWDACFQSIQKPSLDTLQALLLLSQYRSSSTHAIDPEAQWTILGAAVSMAQKLGLNHEPQSRFEPRWESRLRRRLVWALFVQKNMFALCLDLASTMDQGSWTVSMLTEADFDVDEKELPHLFALAHAHSPGYHFLPACQLSLVIRDIRVKVFSISARERLRMDDQLANEKLSSLQLRLLAWKNMLPGGASARLMPEPPTSVNRGGASMQQTNVTDHLINPALHLAWLTARVELARARLRPVRPRDENFTACELFEAVSLPVESLAFLRSLDRVHVAGFWTSYSNIQFEHISSYFGALFVRSRFKAIAKRNLDRMFEFSATFRQKQHEFQPTFSPHGFHDVDDQAGPAHLPPPLLPPRHPAPCSGRDVFRSALTELDRYFSRFGADGSSAMSPDAQDVWIEQDAFDSWVQQVFLAPGCL